MLWIIALVLLVIIGNLLWLLPSREERRRMNLRNQALKEGLGCREIRNPARLPENVDPAEGPWMEYALPIENETEPGEEYPALSMIRSAEGQWSGSVSLAPDMLASLPESAVRVRFRDDSIAVLWNEQGEKSDVAGIVRFLEESSTLKPRDIIP